MASKILHFHFCPAAKFTFHNIHPQLNNMKKFLSHIHANTHRLSAPYTTITIYTMLLWWKGKTKQLLLVFFFTSILFVIKALKKKLWDALLSFVTTFCMNDSLSGAHKYNKFHVWQVASPYLHPPSPPGCWQQRYVNGEIAREPHQPGEHGMCDANCCRQATTMRDHSKDIPPARESGWALQHIALIFSVCSLWIQCKCE